MKTFTKFAALAVVCALNVVSVSASAYGVHPADRGVRDSVIKASQEKRESAHSRRLLAGDACFTYVDDTLYPNWDVYEGSCGAFGNKDEDHWCSAGEFSDFGYDGALCVAESKDDCCTLNSGALAGTVVGCVVGLIGIIVLFAFICKCCCFRPKQIVIAQQPMAPQVVVVPAGGR